MELLQKPATCAHVGSVLRVDDVGTMLADSGRLLSTVEQVLKAGEVGQRGKHKARLPVDIASLARECAQEACARRHLPEDAIILEEATNGQSTQVMGDPADLRSALWNVLDNAIKYSPGTPRVRVRTSVDPGDWVTVRVIDSGIGISPMHRKYIFRRFYRVPSRAVLRARGTGLGLFLVRSILRQHGGDATAYSEGEGRGTTITLQLPRLTRAQGPVS
jgi:signal transduction histidine kinase